MVDSTTFQALSHERLQKTSSDVFGQRISHGGLSDMLRRDETRTDVNRAMWPAKGEAAVRTVVATPRMTSGAGTFSTVLDTIGA